MADTAGSLRRREPSVTAAAAAAASPAAATGGGKPSYTTRGGQNALTSMPTPEFFSGKFEKAPHLIHGPRLALPLGVLAVVYALVYLVVPGLYHGHCEGELDNDPEVCAPEIWGTPVHSDTRTRPFYELLDRASAGSGSEAADVALGFYAIGAVWGLSVLAHMYTTVGWWPLMSYTLQSWVYATVRAGCAFAALALRRGLGVPAEGTVLAGVEHGLVWLCEFLRFPALAQNVVTFVIWWSILVPIIYIALRRSGDDRVEAHARAAGFLKWNASPFLINVHGLNVVLAGFDMFYLLPRALDWVDLWYGFVVGLAYMLFYLTQLDAKGIHFYIILNPRTNWSVVAYVKLLVLYYFIWDTWNDNWEVYAVGWEASAASVLGMLA